MLTCGISFFFFNDTATTEIYTLSLHDALPISAKLRRALATLSSGADVTRSAFEERFLAFLNANELPRPDRKKHTSELQSRQYLVCRLLLEKKKTHSIHTLSKSSLPITLFYSYF